MKNQKNKTLAAIALALILIVSALMAIAPTNTVEAQDDYGDLLQYEWRQRTSTPDYSHFSDGPAPSSPDILWKATIPNKSGMTIAFGGFVFTGSRSPPKTYALDPFTGEIKWVGNYSGSVFKLDDTRMLVGNRCVETATGNVLWQASFGRGEYCSETKMVYTTSAASPWEAPAFQAWDLSDLSQPPTLLWARSDIKSDGGTGTVYGDGRLYGSGVGKEMAINATTGETIWETLLQGSTYYIGAYYMGRWLKGSLDGRFYALDGATGEIDWICSPGNFWSYWCSAMATGYGKVYMYNLDTHLYAIDMETGEIVWKYKGPGHFYAGWGAVADGKVYWTTGTSDYMDPVTHEPGVDEYTCLDAETGQLIWKIPIIEAVGRGGGAYHMIAYGNLYFTPYEEGPLPRSSLGELWCISSQPNNSPMFRNAEFESIGSGPTDLSLKWKFQTDSVIISSPAVVDGVAYVGSHDKNIYAIDADTGTKIWSFTTEYHVKSSPAVVNGRLYTGADDGNIYCLDATTGTQLWKTLAGGVTDIVQSGGPRIRSSPTVVGGKVFVGALDGNFYCLNAISGNIIWTFDAEGPVMSSAWVDNNNVYFSGTTAGNGTLFKLDTNGNEIWRLEIPYQFGPPREMSGSPTVVDDIVFASNNGRKYFAINATTSEIIWEYAVTSQAGRLPAYGSMLYAEGKVYFSDFFGLTCLNAFNGTKIWSTWLAREVYSTPRYFMGKIYVGCENKALFVLDAETGEKISYYEGFISQSIWSSPALYNNKVYVGSHDGNLYCFEQADLGLTTYYGTAAQTASVPDLVEPAPVVQAQLPETGPSPTIESTTLTPINMYLIAAAVAVVAVIVAAAIFLRKRK